jgi:CRISPR-associated protein Cas2
MVVYILESVPPGLRGELTRWMLEPHAGVFVGKISAMVREKLWEKICSKVRDGGCIMIHSTNNEQGFSINVWGITQRTIVEYEGLMLVRKNP